MVNRTNPAAARRLRASVENDAIHRTGWLLFLSSIGGHSAIGGALVQRAAEVVGEQNLALARLGAEAASRC